MALPSSYFFPTDVEGTAFLVELALDLRWSWNHSADEVWQSLEPELWELTHNPWVVLQTVSRTRLKELLADAAFGEKVKSVLRVQHETLGAPGWFQESHGSSPLTHVAYLSMEFMLSEGLPIYSGGLGNVAGDQLKAASDLGVPVTGVGLLYQQGYFRQVIDGRGSQRALYPYNDPGQLPITPVRDEEGEWVRLEVSLPGYKVWLRAWQAQVGRVNLYLLDSNDPANSAPVRGITSELYGGTAELRLMQELVLGIGGWRLLQTLKIAPEVCHLNEGHAAFAVLERARSFMEASGQPFDVALAVTRAGNVFTTHTPVAAGFDRFAPELIDQYLGNYARNGLGVDVHRLLALGRANAGDPHEPFNMAYLATRGSGSINGVSRLHGQVSRGIFRSLFPRWPEVEVPVDHVTNGVHVPSWDSRAADDLWTNICGQQRWRGTMETVGDDIRCASDELLWQMRATSRLELIAYTRQRLALQTAAAGASADEIRQTQQVFNPNGLTLGFARRFATYKRPNLLLHDPDRLLRLLNDPQRPVQLVIAGKAHPADQEGQAMVAAWVQFTQRPEARRRAVFLHDYDMLLAEHLVQGVDVWINTPRRPWEASGTSGMKVLVNGGLNLSELDGWWAEAYTREVGWAVGDGKEHREPEWDIAEAEGLYAVLERDVIPSFYERDARGIPVNWVARMRQSMGTLTPRFSANRTVREYTERYYLPAAAAYNERAADRGARGKVLVDWQRALARQWPAVHFGKFEVTTADGRHVFRVHVYLGELQPEFVQVQLYADASDTEKSAIQVMTRQEELVGAVCGYVYAAQVGASRPAGDYTPRVVPRHAGAQVPLEAQQILWYR